MHSQQGLLLFRVGGTSRGVRASRSTTSPLVAARSASRKMQRSYISSRSTSKRALSSMAHIPAAPGAAALAGAVFNSFDSLPPAPRPPQLRARLQAQAIQRQQQQLKASVQLPSSMMLEAAARSSSHSAVPSSTVKYAGSTLPARGRPLLPRRERRLVSKQHRKDARKKAASSTLAAQLGVATSKTSPFVRIDRQFKTFKPLTPSLRWVRFTLNPHLNKEGPERALTIAKRRTGGRNHHGRITVRGRGGGHRRRLRLVDFYRWEAGEQEVKQIEYDPGRTAHIALLEHKVSRRRSYILAPDGLRAGDTVRSYRTDGMGKSSSTSAGADAATTSLNFGVFRTQAVRPGNVLPLNLIPIGTMIHAISLLPQGPAKLVRSAGTSGQLIAFSHRKAASGLGAGLSKDGQQLQASQMDATATLPSADAETIASESVSLSPSSPPTHAQIKLQSGEVRLVPAACCATIGRVSNIDHEHRRLGKAGRSRWLGRKPKVRGVAMNKTDHPNGGGRGKSKSNMQSKSIYGHLAKFARTRKPGTRGGNTMVIRERPRRNGKRLGKP
ncbi:ribosomal protein L2 [Tilletiaria anomala UBC 951]|uniref:Large ribosomal subunit protein uL2m n=1 Tax=Tilletiaria anomala (strain ATCC 24038 / CBS 436.72 / UBC 951) TaxID=1037660 RepID=A0A066W571_TILAU|nr:ribosomal protein L2 [Tilletiaria anomala UBC 951]KDN45905.1 ribosomal protein L2 [Tilletiaria anomala UBC 951]